MTPGTITLRSCSHCKGQISEYVNGSGNNFGARYWTDGKCEAPMLPDEPDLVKCPYCLRLIWITDQPKLGGGDSSLFRVHVVASEAREPLLPELVDYEKLLSSRLRSKRKEIDARISTWWKGNDPYRNCERTDPMSSFETENLRALLGLLHDNTEGDVLMKAELYRELGEFDSAVAVLSGRRQQHGSAALILELATKKISAVRILPIW